MDLDLEELPQSLILVEYESLHKICFHCGEFVHTEATYQFKNPRNRATIGTSNTQAMIELMQALKLDSTENTMVFGPWMLQQRKPQRWNPMPPSQAPTTSNNQIQPP
ncbi:hypothetical protein SLE2022_395240 [Rubroshorea leprosula]